MVLIFIMFLLGPFTQSTCMQVSDQVQISTVNLVKSSTPDKEGLEELYKVLNYKKTSRFASLRCVGNYIKNSKDESLKQWLKTPQGCAFLLEAFARVNFQHLPRAVGLIKAGFFLEIPEARGWLKEYLEKNSIERSEIQEQYFHHLLMCCTVDEIKYYREIGLTFSSSDASGCTWLISATIENLTNVVRYFVENAKEYGINIHARDVRGMNALVYALIAPNLNPDIIEVLWANGVRVPENYKHLLVNLRTCLPQVQIKVEKNIKNGFH